MGSDPRTATFLFTDLENSTALWDGQPELMQGLSARHDAILQAAIEAHRGRVVKTTGDGFHAVFETANDGLAAALDAQRAITGEAWPVETGPLQVRMGLHTGQSQLRGGDYFGPEVNRAARIMGLAHGGQVLISQATSALVRNSLPPQISLLDLGRHRLRGLSSAEQIFQVQLPGLPSEFPPLKSLSVVQHNLPAQLTTFVGREQELADIQRLLDESRLLTLLGPGGTGKTRLMLEVGEEVIGNFLDGVWLVELAPLTDPDLVADRVAAALSVQEQPGRPMRDALVDFLRRKELLLLLDNVEHLVQECARLAEHLLIHCPKLKILVTGREALFIGGETTLQIPSLSLPQGEGADVVGDLTLVEIGDSEAVQLFLARAREIHPDLKLSQANGAAIAEIVRRLDGIPLALELATARTRFLSVEQIAGRLNDRFRLLTGGRRTALPRQQTLQATIDWSWNLLDKKERLLLQRLSVFSGGWTLEAAQAVAGLEPLDEYTVFDLLEQLVNKSLVTVSYPAEGEARYGMLESIRQYGLDRLFEAGEGEALRDRHADYFVSFAEEVGAQIGKLNARLWKSIVLELDNLRAVLAWTIDDHPELALRIGADLLYFEAQWLMPREARSWLEPAIERTREQLNKEGTKVRTDDFIRALIGLMTANGIQGRNSVALSLAEEVIPLARSSGNSRQLVLAIAIKNFRNPFSLTPEGMRELEEAISISRRNGFEMELGFTLMVYGAALDAQGKTELAAACYREALEISGKFEYLFDANILHTHARLAQMQGNLEEAKMAILPAIERYKALNHRRSLAMGQSAMAHILREEGDFEEAKAYYQQSIVGWQAIGHQGAVAHQLECFAYIAIAQDQYERAARLLGAAGSVRQEFNSLSDDPHEIQDVALAMERLSGALGEAERDGMLAQGRLMDLDSAVDFALEGEPA